MTLFRLRPLLAIVGLAGALALVAVDLADARSSRGGSLGSRGTRTYSAPAPTATAPSTARPIERSMTQPGQTSNVGRAATPSPAPAGGLFGRPGFLGGLAAGFLGAGLLGMLFGGGLFGGLAGFASILGFIAQLALIGVVAWLIVRWWSRRSQPAEAFAGGGPRPMLEPQRRMDLGAGSGPGAVGGGMGAGVAAAAASSPIEIELTPADFDVFERLLGEIQTAYGREDLAALRARATPEMLSYFSEDLAENASRGVVNEISDIKLLQGDLSESWREGEVEYATVAMRYELVDRFVDRASGRVVEGDATRPEEVIELWTFMRARGGNWILSAIQQA